MMGLFGVKKQVAKINVLGMERLINLLRGGDLKTVHLNEIGGVTPIQSSRHAIMVLREG